MPTIETEDQAILTDTPAPKIETTGRMPEDSFRNEDYRGEVAAAVAKLKGEQKEPETAPEAQTEKTDAERARDEKGRFAPKAADAPAEQAETIVKPTEDDKDAQPTEDPAPKPVGAPPPGWSAESKAAFTALPPSVQADVLKREKEVSDGFRSMSERMRPLAAVDEVLSPRREYFAQHGFANDAQVVSHLLSYSDAMDRDPAGTLKILAQAYNVDLGKMTGVSAPVPTAEGGVPIEQAFPEVASITRQNAELQQRLQAIEGHFIAQQRQAEARRLEEERRAQDEITSTVTSFATDKPHFEKVRPLMAGLLQSGAAKGLEDAYQMAVFADPETRAALQAEEDAKRRAAEDAKKREAAEKAKKAAVSVRQSPAPPAPRTLQTRNTTDADDVRADVLAAMRKVSARV